MDFIVGDRIAIEVKATERPNSDDLKGLRAIAEENSWERRILVCDASKRQNIDGISVVPWQAFLSELWSDRIL